MHMKQVSYAAPVDVIRRIFARSFLAYVISRDDIAEVGMAVMVMMAQGCS